ncbi:proteasome assembly chaperone 4 [Prinia subflava]|uniref:proteasome assembly chaperone 4 n=1 Tax=Prinia subflava TaxID=208062 RepID=UPI002FE27CC7
MGRERCETERVRTDRGSASSGGRGAEEARSRGCTRVRAGGAVHGRRGARGGAGTERAAGAAVLVRVRVRLFPAEREARTPGRRTGRCLPEERAPPPGPRGGPRSASRSGLACSGPAAPGEAAMEAAGGGAAGGIALHDFSGQLGEQRVHFHAMRLRDSLFLWVGAAPALASLAVAMCSPRDSIPVAASLLGDPSDTASSCLAQRLASKTKKQIFVSYNLQNTDSNFTLLIENRIKEEMTAFPEKF